MILCPSCGIKNIHAAEACSQCGFEPVLIDGFIAWAPELARHNDGFSEDSFKKLARVEEDNFWFRSRNALILWALRKYMPRLQSLLEVGCGTGYVLSGITRAFPHARTTGSEIHTAGLAYAAKRLPTVELLQMDARKLPYHQEFDVVAALDVIEHIVEDELVLQNFYRAVKAGGVCLITVPQHRWLWSPVDDAACHKRRYTAADLHAKLEAAGFKILRSTSFVTLLLPLMLISRLAARRSAKGRGSEVSAVNRTLNRVLEAIMCIERMLIKLGVNLPVGGSRLVVAKKEL